MVDNWSGFINQVKIEREEPASQFRVSFPFNPSSVRWKQPYSIIEYVAAFNKVYQSRNEPLLSWVGEADEEAGEPEYEFYVYLTITDEDAAIISLLEKYETMLQEMHDAAVLSLNFQLRSDAVVVSFDFPEEIRVAWEQYLLYFVQFLKDVGVSASAELEHNAGHVLFAVKPDDKDQALDGIRRALSIYLQLPTNPVVELSSGYDTDIKVQQLTANIYHLQGQVALSRAMLQAKDTTIQALQVIINQQQYVPSDILINSMNQTPQTEKEDKEVLFGGMVALKNYQGKGYEINLPLIYRWVKKLLEDNDIEPD